MRIQNFFSSKGRIAEKPRELGDFLEEAIGRQERVQSNNCTPCK